jgi:uncharacterized membrane protein
MLDRMSPSPPDQEAQEPARNRPKDARQEELPPSVSENIETITAFYQRHEEHMSLPQTIIEKMSVMLGSPGYVAASVIFMIGWIVANLVAMELGFEEVDEPPFFWLQGIIAVNAFIISTTVLIRQNRMSKLAQHHARLDLQVNLLTEEKTSKIIAMLEALRRDLPGVAGNVDHEAHEMAEPADAKTVLEVIESETDNCEKK